MEIIPSPDDVRLGLIDVLEHHLGNQRVDYIISTKVEEFIQSEGSDFQSLASEILDEVAKVGGRCLKCVNLTWLLADATDVKKLVHMSISLVAAHYDPEAKSNIPTPGTKVPIYLDNDVLFSHAATNHVGNGKLRQLVMRHSSWYMHAMSTPVSASQVVHFLMFKIHSAGGRFLVMDDEVNPGSLIVATTDQAYANVELLLRYCCENKMRAPQKQKTNAPLEVGAQPPPSTNSAHAITEAAGELLMLNKEGGSENLCMQHEQLQTNVVTKKNSGSEDSVDTIIIHKSKQRNSAFSSLHTTLHVQSNQLPTSSPRQQSHRFTRAGGDLPQMNGTPVDVTKLARPAVTETVVTTTPIERVKVAKPRVPTAVIGVPGNAGTMDSGTVVGEVSAVDYSLSYKKTPLLDQNQSSSALDYLHSHCVTGDVPLQQGFFDTDVVVGNTFITSPTSRQSEGYKVFTRSFFQKVKQYEEQNIELTTKRVDYIAESLVKNYITSGGRFLQYHRDGQLEVVLNQATAFALVKNVLENAQRKAYMTGVSVKVTSVLLKYFGTERTKRKAPASDGSGEPNKRHARSKTTLETGDNIHDKNQTLQRIEHRNVATPVKSVAGGPQQVQIATNAVHLHVPGGQNIKPSSLHQLNPTAPSRWMTAQASQEMTVPWQQTKLLQQQAQQFYYLNQVPPHNMLLHSASQLFHKEQMATGVNHLSNQGEEQYQYVAPPTSISSYTQQMLTEVTAKSREIDIEYGCRIDDQSPKLRDIQLKRKVNLRRQVGHVKQHAPKGMKGLTQDELVVRQRHEISTLKSQLGKLQQRQKNKKIKKVAKITVPGQMNQIFREKQLSNGKGNVVDTGRNETNTLVTKNLKKEQSAVYTAYSKNENPISKPSLDLTIQQGSCSKIPNREEVTNKLHQHHVKSMRTGKSPNVTIEEELTKRGLSTTSEAQIAVPGWSTGDQGSSDVSTARILSGIKANTPKVPSAQIHVMNKLQAKEIISKQSKFVKQPKLHKSMLSSRSSFNGTDSQAVSDADMKDFSKWEFIPWEDPINPNYPCVTCEWTLTLVPLDGQASDPIHLDAGSFGFSFD